MGTPISSLPLASTPTGTEYVPIVQSGTTKRATVLEVAQTLLPITTDEISDGNITAAKLAADSVTTVKILDSNVTAAKLASGAAVSNIGTGGITATQLAADSVTTVKILNANVTAAKLDGQQSGSAPIFGARAWVNFDGTRDSGGNLSTANTNRLIRASGNVTSVLRNGTGDYTITFTTGMPDANYAFFGSSRSTTDSTSGYSPGMYPFLSDAKTTTTIRLRSYNTNQIAQDSSECDVVIFR